MLSSENSVPHYAVIVTEIHIHVLTQRFVWLLTGLPLVCYVSSYICKFVFLSEASSLILFNVIVNNRVFKCIRAVKEEAL